MKIKLSIFIIAIGFCFLSCDKNDIETDSKKIGNVTGVRMTDWNGAAIGQVGNPNTKQGIFSVFPNPANDFFSLNGPNGIESFVIKKGEKDTNFPEENFDQTLKDFAYSESQINENFEFGYYYDSLVNIANINVQQLETGYYRIFYRASERDEYLWDNIYINHEIPYPAMIDSLVNDWK